MLSKINRFRTLPFPVCDSRRLRDTSLRLDHFSDFWNHMRLDEKIASHLVTLSFDFFWLVGHVEQIFIEVVEGLEGAAEDVLLLLWGGLVGTLEA